MQLSRNSSLDTGMVDLRCGIVSMDMGVVDGVVVTMVRVDCGRWISECV